MGARRLIPRVVCSTAAVLLVTLGFAQTLLLSNPPWARGPDIFVPKPKEETLDPSSGGKGAGVDVVTTVAGDRLTGRILDVSAEGFLRLAAPQFHGPALVKVSSLARIVMSGRAGVGGADEVLLTNGDRLIGEVVAITKDSVIVETDVVGPVKVRRPVVQAISLSRGRTLLVDSRFEAGEMAPWAVRSGSWPIKDGKLTCASTGSRYTVYAKVDQREPAVFEAKVKALGGNNLQLYMIIFAERSDSTYGRNSVFARFYGSQYYLRYAFNNSTNSIANKSVGTTMREGTFRVGYDPASGKARVWLNGKLLGEHVVPAGQRPKSGQYVMFSSYYPCEVSYLRVHRGMSGASPGGTAADDSDTVQFGNRDRISASDVSLADGTVVLTTPFGTIRTPMEKITGIVFRTKGREAPRRQKGDALVEAADCRLTLKFKGMTATHLIGASDCFGEVTVKRSALRSIKFSIYR